MKEVKREYSGENISKYIIEIIKKYGIKKNLGYFVIDNTPNNNTIIIALFQAL